MALNGPIQKAKRLADDGIFQELAKVLLVVVSLEVANELVTVNNHANRAAFARVAIQNPDLYAYPFALLLAAKQSVDISTTDGALLVAARSVYDAIAGVV